MLFGIIILVIGVIFLLQNLGLFTASIWAIFWPVLLIVIGLAVIFRRKHCWWCGGHHMHHGHDWQKFGQDMKERFGHYHHENGEEEEKEQDGQKDA